MKTHYYNYNNINIFSKWSTLTKALILFFPLLFSAISMRAQDSVYARRIIRDLSAPGMYGRAATYNGDSIAADYLRLELRRLRATPLGVNYYQTFSYNSYAMEGQLWLDVNGKRLRNYDEFRVMPWSARVVSPSLQVLNLSLETFADSEKLHKFIVRHEGSMSDCFVYINTCGLDKFDAHTQSVVKNKLRQLRIRNMFGSRGLIVGVEVLSTYSLSSCDQLRGYCYIEVLGSAMPKNPKTVNVCVNNYFRPNHKSQNVCGLFSGEVDTMMVFVAHYDHIGMMGDGFKYMKNSLLVEEGKVLFAGAHDNASGVAAVMDLARMASKEKPHYTMVFMFLAGEEAGLKGSTYAAAHPLIDFSKVKLLVNLDLFCGGNEGLMVFNANSEQTKPFFNRIKTLNDVLQIAPEVRARDNAPNSDHYPFSRLCPSIYILTMGGPFGGYHDPKDICTSCSLENYYNYLLLISSLTL